MSASALHRKWLANAERRRVDPATIDAIGAHWRLGPEGFAALASMVELTDPHGKSFFLLPADTTAARARAAALQTCLLNAGTGYGDAGAPTDFAPTAYSLGELRRVAARQQANRWSYGAVRPLLGSGGALVATPNGILMGLGGSGPQTRFVRRGGTTYGDLFLINLDPRLGAGWQLRVIVESGRMWYRGDGAPVRGGLDLDRILHHEERHCRQWARLGPVRMVGAYLGAEARARWSGGVNRFEAEAGLADGGYR